ncbi:hypothetical protein WJX81_005091 [Elliptochloris bilobata]|uniref:HMA domain-containing protein n=1 Tax=Elliptochloris bilobata TaxID=381761 RepID=A0AAW1SLP8_9CHLO
MRRAYGPPIVPSASVAQSDLAAEPADTVVLDVRGMKCGGCSAAVRRILLAEPGVESAAVNLLTDSAVPRAVEAGLADEAAASEARRRGELQRSMVDLAVAWGLVAPGVSLALGAAALAGPGRPLVVDGAKSLVRGVPNMNSLIAMGALTSFAAGLATPLVPGLALDGSALEEPIMLLAFVLLGRTLEARARLKASADLRSLARLIPARSRLLLRPPGEPASAPATAAAVAPLASEDSKDAADVPTASVRAGDMLLVLPGERVPVDGEVVAGRGSCDEAMLTGESALVPKAPGAQVTAGTVVYEAPLSLRATTTGAGSTLAGIARLVTAAQAREAPVQRLADAVAGRFCYSVMAASAATFAFWALLGGSAFPEKAAAAAVAGGGGGAVFLGARLAVDVLVVACPCALGLATPTAVLVASSAGARRGLLLRGGDVLERAAQVDTVALDKTGTLTEGRLRLVASAPGPSTNPSSEAAEWEARAAAAGLAGCTTVYVGEAGRGVLGALGFRDALRPDAAATVARLRAMGLRVALLSGDNPAAVAAAAADAGIPADSAWGGMRPEAKAAAVAALRASGRTVAMVGDGVNDAPALAAADVGVALGGGADAAGEAAGIVLMGDRLGQVAEALALGRATLAKIRQNLAWALCYNLVAIPLAAGAALPAFGVALSPSAAGGLMAFSSLAVVGNSLLLRSQTEALDAAGGGSRTEASKESPDAVVQTAEPYITHTWRWRDHTINYAVAGCGKPVLIVHGFGASIGHFRRNIPELAQTHKVYALDLLGFGRSDKPLLSYTLELWRDLVLDFLAEFCAGAPALLVGNSMGSLICLNVAAAAPEGAVRGLALLNCAGGMNSKSLGDDWRIKVAAPAFMLVDFLLSRQRVARYLFDSFRQPTNLKNVLQRVYIDQTAVDDALVDLIYQPSNADGALEAFVSVITGPPGDRPEMLIDRVKGPLLILWGDRDVFIPCDGPVGKFFQALPGKRPDTEFIMLKGVGHCPHDDNPVAVNNVLTAWLAKHH